MAIGAGLALYATGVLELDQVLAGYGDATVVLIASLFVVSEGLDATGVTTWAGQAMIARAGTDRSRLLVYVMLLVALLTAGHPTVTRLTSVTAQPGVLQAALARS